MEPLTFFGMKVELWIAIIVLIFTALGFIFKPWNFLFKPKLKFKYSNDDDIYKVKRSIPNNAKKINNSYLDGLIISQENNDSSHIDYDVSLGVCTSLLGNTIPVNKPISRDSIHQIIEQNGYTNGCFIRFGVTNQSKKCKANDCRCKIKSVKTKSGDALNNYVGFTLRWANRPESALSPLGVERLDIGIEETEYIDLALAMANSNKIFLESYHSVPDGIKDTMEPGKYIITLTFSGSNFSSHTITYELSKKNNDDINDINVSKFKVLPNNILGLTLYNIWNGILWFWRRKSHKLRYIYGEY